MAAKNGRYFIVIVCVITQRATAFDRGSLLLRKYFLILKIAQT
jgi:hypothetical protein